MREVFSLLCFMLGMSFISFSDASDTKKPILIYNQFPLSWMMDFEKMAGYLPFIAKMGFNVVWVNPFFKSTNREFFEVDEGNGVCKKAKNSLYEMYDPSLTWSKSNGMSTGNPSGDEPIKEAINKNIRNYTDQARANGLTPIFDLVLNHVATDSPLVSGEFSYFNKLDINTNDWFDDKGKWGKGFDYTTEEKCDAIFENLWKPLITRAINDFGFDGVRIDYGTAVNQKVLKRCIELIRTLKNDATVTIAFGEALIPSHVNIIEQLNNCQSTHFTHLTNNAFALSKKSIMEGKFDGNGNIGYWWFLHDLGLKKAITKQSSKFWSGTIGFSGSHDDGTTLQRGAYLLINGEEVEKEAEQLMSPNVKLDFLADSNLSQKRNICKKIAKGKLIDKKLNEEFSTEEAKISLAKERIAIAAFSSDAGWYLLAGDEKLSTTTKRPFVDEKGVPFGGEENMEASINDAMPRFVKSVNETFINLRESTDKFWVEIFYLFEEKGMCFVRHISDSQVDVVVVNLRSMTGYSKNDIKNIIDTIDKYAYLPEHIDVNDTDKIRFYFVN